MDSLLIYFKLDTEFFFPKYNDYILKKEEKQLEIGDTVQIGSVECKIIEKLEKDNYKLEVINTLPAQFVNCIQCLIDENYEIYTSLIDNVSCKEEEVECEFYINKNISLIILSRELRYKNNLKKCSSCSEYFNLDAKYVSDDAKYVPDDGKDFCSYNCNESFALSQDQIF